MLIQSNFRLRACVGLMLASLGALSSLPAQVTTATVSGTVTDTSGAIVSGAKVELKNLGTDVAQSVSTDAQGRYSAPDLPIGNYEIQASQPGFQTVVHRGITLTVGSQSVVDFSLQVGQAQQTVVVEGQVTQVETTSSTIANLVESTQMRELPLNGRNFQQLITLAPGVQVAQTSTSQFYGKGDTYSVAGGRPEGQAFLLDGTDITNFFNHGTGAGVLGTSLGIDAIGEFQTLTNTYGAQFGGSGAVVNAVSKSGTNSFHGTAFEFIRNSALDARNFFDGSQAPSFRRNQFGGAVGGPVKKDKMFFFVNYEGLRQALGVTQIALVPDANARQGLLPIGAGGTLVNVGVNPAVTAALALYPATSLTSATGVVRVPQVGTQVGHENYILSRFDYTISEKDSFFGRFVSDRADFLNPFPNGPYLLWPDIEKSPNLYATAEERHIFSAALVNVARVSYVRTDSNAVTPNSYPALQPFPGSGHEDINLAVAGLSTLGPQRLDPFRIVQNKYTLYDDVYWTRGAHTVKLGFSVQRLHTLEFAPFNGGGQYTFNSLQQLLQNQAFTWAGALPNASDSYHWYREYPMTPYINDDWKVTSRLTLNAGLRYEFDTNPIDLTDNLYAITNPPAGTGYTKVHTVFARNPNKGNWDPRAGFAYDPFKDHKTSIRGGFGLFHNMIAPRVWTSSPATHQPFVTVTQTNPIFPTPALTGVNLPLPSEGQGYDYQTEHAPYLMQWNVNVQREVIGGTVLTAGYVGSRGVHLFSQHDLNPPIPTIDANGVYHFTTNGVTNPRINPALSVFNDAVAFGNSWYQSLQLNATKRFSHNVQAQIAYTWSHSIDLGSGTSGLEVGGGGQENPYFASYDRGSSAFDIRHTVRANGLVMLPFKGNPFVRGWQLSGILSASTGTPFSASDGFDRAGLLNGAQRPNLNPGFTAENIVTHNPAQWFNPAAFSLQPQGTIGNAGRTILRAPGLFNTDLALMKESRISKISEQFGIQFRAEFFNVFNHTNFALPIGNVFTGTGAINPTAGLITATATTSRQLQFGLKVNF